MLMLFSNFSLFFNGLRAAELHVGSASRASDGRGVDVALSKAPLAGSAHIRVASDSCVFAAQKVKNIEQFIWPFFIAKPCR